jgi:hypothetical protein
MIANQRKVTNQLISRLWVSDQILFGYSFQNVNQIVNVDED